MKRQPVDTGGWFRPESATRWGENTRWDGNNHISIATGSQWAHEALYRSAGGAWILHHWSQWQGHRETWERVSPSDAADWLLRNLHEVPEDLAAAVAETEI